MAGDWPPRDRDTFGGYPDFDRYGRFRDEPPQPDPKQATTEELGAEPVMNGPERVNHLAWAKQRALAQIPDIGQVMSSLMQDLADDERTADSVDILRELIFPLAMTGAYGSPAEQRKMILDFG